MFVKAALTIALAIGSITPAFANCPGPGCPASDITGGLVGAVIGGVIVCTQGDNATTACARRERRAVRQTGSAISPDIRIRDRQVQTALNSLGFDAGVPDGVIGPKARSAISDYQRTLAQPQTGRLTEYETLALFSVYLEVIAGLLPAVPPEKVKPGEAAEKLNKRFVAVKANNAGSPIRHGESASGPLPTVPATGAPLPTSPPAQRSPAPPRAPWAPAPRPDAGSALGPAAAR